MYVCTYTRIYIYVFKYGLLETMFKAQHVAYVKLLSE